MCKVFDTYIKIPTFDEKVLESACLTEGGGRVKSSLLPGCISFICLIVDLLLNTADKYKDPNESNTSAE